MKAAETTQDLQTRILVADSKAEQSVSRLEQCRERGFAAGLRSCLSIVDDRDAKAAELLALRVALKLGPRESIGLAVRWLKEKQ